MSGQGQRQAFNSSLCGSTIPSLLREDEAGASGDMEWDARQKPKFCWKLTEFVSVQSHFSCDGDCLT